MEFALLGVFALLLPIVAGVIIHRRKRDPDRGSPTSIAIVVIMVAASAPLIMWLVYFVLMMLSLADQS